MPGRIKVGRWLPCTARQVSNPHRGFVWAATAGVIAGTDRHIGRRLGPTPVELNLHFDPAGRIQSLVFDQWGDPDATGA
jgi:hypothetical protein